ncbi:uncharacterized protein LOC143730779 [Siphateles boraxobius]|uniref:uncharacterized protein LOC143730779 n=1 Tax=Siphateles boraxobius TaxID=180520 RepID=UPI004063C858
MKRRKKISRNHRSAENKKTERKMEDRNETQTSESREERGQRLHRCDSMERLKPNLSCDPDGPGKFEPGVKTEEILIKPFIMFSRTHNITDIIIIIIIIFIIIIIITDIHQQLKT